MCYRNSVTLNAILELLLRVEVTVTSSTFTFVQKRRHLTWVYAPLQIRGRGAFIWSISHIPGISAARATPGGTIANCYYQMRHLVVVLVTAAGRPCMRGVAHNKKQTRKTRRQTNKVLVKWRPIHCTGVEEYVLVPSLCEPLRICTVFNHLDLKKNISQ